MLVVAFLQAAIALTALTASRGAFVAASAIGVLAIARYGSLALFSSTLGSGAKSGLRILSVSSWLLGLMALGVALAAVAVKARPVLPWAAVAALAGPLGMSVLAFGTGLGRLFGPRLGHSGGKR
jgi:hypothetical protein